MQRVTIRLSEDECAALKALAVAHGTTVAEAARTSIARAFSAQSDMENLVSAVLSAQREIVSESVTDLRAELLQKMRLLARLSVGVVTNGVPGADRQKLAEMAVKIDEHFPES